MCFQPAEEKIQRNRRHKSLLDSSQNSKERKEYNENDLHNDKKSVSNILSNLLLLKHYLSLVKFIEKYKL